MGGTADEGRFIELIIANERVQRWLDEISKLSRGSKRCGVIYLECAETRIVCVNCLSNQLRCLLPDVQAASPPQGNG